MNILSLCDYTGNMVRPWLEAGHTATIVDLQHPQGADRVGRLTRVGADVLTWRPCDRFDVAFAFPPCTDLAVSGARHFKSKGPARLLEALRVVLACMEAIRESGAPQWMVEQPVSTLATYWRRPDWYFSPWEYGGYLSPPGDRYAKQTSLWTSAAFRMPMKRPVHPSEGSKMHRLPPSKDRANLRSATPMGFARAVFEANALGCGESLGHEWPVDSTPQRDCRQRTTFQTPRIRDRW